MSNAPDSEPAPYYDFGRKPKPDYMPKIDAEELNELFQKYEPKTEKKIEPKTESADEIIKRALRFRELLSEDEKGE